jgi:hypothetical protein
MLINPRTLLELLLLVPKIQTECAVSRFTAFPFLFSSPLNFGDLMLPLVFTLFRSLTQQSIISFHQFDPHVLDDVLVSHFVMHDVVGLFFNHCHLASILNFPFLIITVYNNNNTNK